MREIKNLSNTKWQLFDNISVIGTGVNVFNINFVAYNTEYSTIKFEDAGKSGNLYYDDTLVCSYPDGEWVNEDYQTIRIDGGKDVTNDSLIIWLKKYGTNSTATVRTSDIVDALRAVEAALGGVQ